MKKKEKILTDRCAEPRETWRPLAVAGAPKKPFMGGFGVPLLLTAAVGCFFFFSALTQPEDEVPDADSIEMVIASTDEPVPEELVEPSPAVVSRWQPEAPNEQQLSPSRLDKAGEEVAAYISRSYRLSITDARQMVEWAVEVGAGLDVDPLLILAVVGTESSFNPKAKSKAGAEGLMQVMTKVHQEKFKAFGGREAAFEPYPNMVVGTTILKSLINRTGSVTKALKWYSGAANHKTDYGYGAKVLQERSRLLVAAEGDSDSAVKLLRAKRNGPTYRKNIIVTRLDFSDWSKVAEATQSNEEALRDLNEANGSRSGASIGNREARIEQIAPVSKQKARVAEAMQVTSANVKAEQPAQKDKADVVKTN